MVSSELVLMPWELADSLYPSYRPCKSFRNDWQYLLGLASEAQVIGCHTKEVHSAYASQVGLTKDNSTCLSDSGLGHC